MRRLWWCAAAAALLGTTLAPAAELKTDQDKILYTMGMMLGRQVASFEFSKDDLAIIGQGFQDAGAGAKPAVEFDQWAPKVTEFVRSRMNQVAEKEKVKGKEFAEKAAKEKGAVKTSSGLVFIEEKGGAGATPKPTDTVKVNYRGTLIDGKEFDSSYKRNEPAQFRLNQVIPCWTEGLQKMKPGAKAKLVCPAEIAYGNNGQPGIPGGATLVFEVELLSIVPESAAPAGAQAPQGAKPGTPPPAPKPSTPPATPPAKK